LNGLSPSAPPPKTLHRFFVPPEQISPSLVQIVGEDAGQISRVLRLRPGARLQVFDGSGRQVEARITEVHPTEVRAELLETTFPQTELPFSLILLQALLKGEKSDGVVEKATELGVASIHFFLAARSIPRLKEERSERKAQRWQRIAKEAAEQCGRVKVPTVAVEGSLSQALQAAGAVKLYFADEAERETAPPLSRSLTDGVPPSSAVLIGPEGGWTVEERDRVNQNGGVPFSLGPRILRAETAALVALARFTG
jgi:16S rRNA (uracil1498-N3)-methyltransferase